MKRGVISLFLLLILIGLGSNSFAQITQPHRFEVELDFRDNPFNVVSLEELGIIIFREVPEFEKGDQLWQFVRLDTTLNPLWERKYFIDNRYRVLGWESTDRTLMLMLSKDPARNKDLLFVRLNLVNGDVQYTEFENIFAIEISHFKLVADQVVVAGKVNYRPTILTYDLKEGLSRVVAGSYNENMEVIQISVDKEFPIFEVLTSVETDRKRMTLTSSIYDASGELIDRTQLKPQEEYNLIFGRSTFGEYRQRLFAGTYSTNRSKYSRGIFVASVDDFGTQKINYYNYADLKNFFNYMKAKRQKRIQDRIERKRIRGKRLKFNYRLMVHDIFLQDDSSFVMLGEAFYPYYGNRNIAYSSRDFRASNPGWDNYYTYQEYKYTHAVAIGFNKRGQIIWDNSFEINDVTTLRLQQFVHAVTDGDEIILLYVYDNMIRSKIIKEGEVIEGKVFNDLKLKFEDDALVEGTAENMELNDWYGKYFYAFGTQKIKNMRDTGVKLNRDVFFINKISYR